MTSLQTMTRKETWCLMRPDFPLSVEMDCVAVCFLSKGLARERGDVDGSSTGTWPFMRAVTTIGLDIAKSVIQVHGIEAHGHVIIRRKLKRRYVPAFFERLQEPGRAFIEPARSFFSTL
jgi:hypothetical protein